MKKCLPIRLLTFCCFLINNFLNGQIALPYYSNFDQAVDTAGWKHYALSGSDDWKWSAPTGTLLNPVATQPRA